MPAPVVAAAAAGGGGAGGGAAGASGGAGGAMAQFGKGGQMLGKKGMGKKDMLDQAQQQDLGEQQEPDLDSARSNMKQPPMPGLELGKSLVNPIPMLKKGMKMGSPGQRSIGGMG